MTEHSELSEIMKNKSIIIDFLKSTQREGIENVIKFLNKTNFFTQEGSYRHHRYYGGLAAHSLGVLKHALNANEYLKNKCNKDSIIICALLHDICKVSYEYTPREFDGGHGTRSVRLLKEYLGLKLTDEEWRAIRFHMAKRNRVFDGEDAIQYNIAERENLRNIIHESDNKDSSASFLKELFF